MESSLNTVPTDEALNPDSVAYNTYTASHLLEAATNTTSTVHTSHMKLYTVSGMPNMHHTATHLLEAATGSTRSMSSCRAAYRILAAGG